ncbi:hypothetical protein SK128_025777 [Halocaridina rubra]|uniref:Peptidase S9 prolyl oligopeptidase catalytic domain-containing protein n=1 Tax=Halocaridina rubra TaxID=373956 RepID=A0AAN8WYK4_HALRR
MASEEGTGAFSPTTLPSDDVTEDVPEVTEQLLLLDMGQSFIPTIPTASSSGDEKGSGRYELKVSSTTEETPGILTIGAGSLWETSEPPRNTGSSTEAPYGTWKSPVSSQMATQGINLIEEPPKVDPVTGNVFWCEEINSENGSHVVFHYNPGTQEIVRWTPKSMDVRTQVHEYGGGAFAVYNNTLFFSNFADGALYRQNGPDAQPVPLTNTSYRRYADGSYCPKYDSLFFVVEDHELLQKGKNVEPENGIVMINAVTGEEKVVAAHADFFSSPRVSPDCNYLAWVQWNHPNMPWGETRVFIGQILNEKGKLAIVKYLQHGSMMTPSFNQNNELFYVHDTSGWWNLYKINKRNFEINLTNQSQEVGWPMWKFGRQAYDVSPAIGSNEAVAICGNDLMVIDSVKLAKRIIQTGYSSYSLGVAYSADGTKVYTIAGDGLRQPRLIEVELATGTVKEIHQDLTDNEFSYSADPVVDLGYISIARQIQFPTTQGDFAYGYLYLPKNQDYHAPSGAKPPLLVKVHEGPTFAASNVLNLEYQFFTSRGFVILDVDYRGSTGYGTLYRTKLQEMFGVYDVDDVLAGAEYLAKEGLVDKSMICIDGASAGGYIALSALTVTGSIFRAGASYYGISDLELLAKDTHKFESQYMEGLIGKIDKYGERYVARSPFKNSQKLDVPMIFFHGSDDKVVPPNQALQMYELVKDKGLPTAFILFEGEYHGFVQAENRRRALEAEIYFFAEIFNLKLGDIISDIVIDNLEAWRAQKQAAIKRITLH